MYTLNMSRLIEALRATLFFFKIFLAHQINVFIILGYDTAK